ncbi:hypothetical protein C8Q79DRAFT_685550 [Trametes meyenii]|nr:hypothetical protein C8Q79DRAFT_685550 [Trametes meyenii]
MSSQHWGPPTLQLPTMMATIWNFCCHRAEGRRGWLGIDVWWGGACFPASCPRSSPLTMWIAFVRLRRHLASSRAHGRISYAVSKKPEVAPAGAPSGGSQNPSFFPEAPCLRPCGGTLGDGRVLSRFLAQPRDAQGILYSSRRGATALRI